MPISDLCTLAQVQGWLPNAITSAAEAELSALITSASGAILSDLQRGPIYSRPVVDTFNGVGQCRQMLRYYPVTSVQSLTIGQSTITQSTISPYTCGWVLEPWDGFLPGKPQMLDLRGREYWPGIQNIVVTYTAGYKVTAEPMVGAASVMALQLNGPWSVDGGVTYASTSIALSYTTTSPPTVTGTYNVAAGIYQFAPGDYTVALLASYSYVPSPLNQACIEVVGEAYSYLKRIGQRSHTQPGPISVAFDLTRFTKAAQWMTLPYRMVVPVL